MASNFRVVLSGDQKAEKALKMKIKRSIWTEEEIERNKNLSKLRMRKMREKLKLEKKEIPSNPSFRTRQQKETEEARKKTQREKKREYRKNLHPQKLRRMKEKDRLAKEKKRQQIKSSKSSKSENGKKSGKKENLTSSTVTVLKDYLKGRKKSQRKFRKLFLKALSDGIRNKYGLKNSMHKILGVRNSYFAAVDDKKRKDTLPENTVDSVKECYTSEVNSINVPNIKTINKDLTNKFVLQKSVSDVYIDWKKENPGQKLSFSKFCSLKPKNVKLQKHRNLVQCLCEYCENVKLKVNTLNKIAVTKNLPKIKDVYDITNKSLCDKVNGQHKLACVQRNCVKCGTDDLNEQLIPYMTDNIGEVCWNKWDYVKTKNPKTGNDITKRQLVEKKGLPSFLVAELVEEVHFLSLHLFVAQWQQRQFYKLTKNVSQGSVVMTADFAENYSCFQQNEIQGAHWAKDAVTIHPVVVNYQCQQCPDEQVEEIVDIISDDLTHDTSAVHKFTSKVFNHLQTNRHLNITKAYLLTDGCAAQYKSKVAFLDTSMAIDDFGFPMERGFYGSRHGKNRCDGEGGVVKSRVARAVRSGEAVIVNANNFYDVCKNTLEKGEVNPDLKCNHQRRTILWVGSAEISHIRPDRTCKTVPGTRKFHSVRGISRGLIKTRELSCFCDTCISDEGECANTDYVGEWKTVIMKSVPEIVPVLPATLDVTPAPDVGPAQPTDLDVVPVPPTAPDVAPAVPTAPDVAPALITAPDVAPALITAPDVGSATPTDLDVMPTQDVTPAPQTVTDVAPALDVVLGQEVGRSLDLDISITSCDLGIDPDTVMGELSAETSFNVDIDGLLEGLELPYIKTVTPLIRHTYKEGDFILIELVSAKRRMEYVAEIVQVLPESEYIVQYMEKCGELYKWPVRPEKSQECINSILKKLPCPRLVEEKSSSRIQFYSFNQQ